MNASSSNTRTLRFFRRGAVALSAAVLARPQPHRVGLRKAQSTKGRRTLDPSALGQDRLDPRSLLPTRMFEFLQSRRLCVISIQNSARRRRRLCRPLEVTGVLCPRLLGPANRRATLAVLTSARNASGVCAIIPQFRVGAALPRGSWPRSMAAHCS